MSVRLSLGLGSHLEDTWVEIWLLMELNCRRKTFNSLVRNNAYDPAPSPAINPHKMKHKPILRTTMRSIDEEADWWSLSSSTEAVLMSCCWAAWGVLPNVHRFHRVGMMVIGLI